MRALRRQHMAIDSRHRRHQRKCCQRIQRIVVSDQRQRIRRKRAIRRRVRATSNHESRRESPFASSASGTVAPKLSTVRPIHAHGQRTRIVAIEHLHAATVERCAPWLLRILVNSRIAIEVVVGDVEHAAAATARARTLWFQLKTGQFQHENIGPGFTPRVERRHDIEHGIPDVAGDHGRQDPAARHSAPASAVTVDLPFEPVIASTFCAGDNARAKISMSPTSSTPRATAACDHLLTFRDARTDGDKIRACQALPR